MIGDGRKKRGSDWVTYTAIAAFSIWTALRRSKKDSPRSAAGSATPDLGYSGLSNDRSASPRTRSRCYACQGSGSAYELVTRQRQVQRWNPDTEQHEWVWDRTTEREHTICGSCKGAGWA